jgi:hypothetical protein
MYRSDLVYAEKLLKEFSDDYSVTHRYARGLIARRFVNAFLMRYQASLRAGETRSARKSSWV